MSTAILDKTGTEHLISKLKAEMKSVLKEQVLKCYPVGTVLFSPSDDYDPNVCIGGTWVRNDVFEDSKGTSKPEGGYYPRMMKASNDTYVNRYINADQWHKLKTSNLPAHTHTVTNMPVLNGGNTQATSGSIKAFKNSGTLSYTTSSAGGDAYASSAYKIEPPYFAVWAWRRTA